MKCLVGHDSERSYVNQNNEQPRINRSTTTLLMLLFLAGVLGQACVGTTPPVEPEPPAAPPTSTTDPPRRPPSPPPIPVEPAPPVIPEDEFSARTLEEINRDAPLEPIFFQYDSSELDEAARQIIENNVDVLRSNPTWIITVEGHCDQRGTPEYNLALGERRALSVQDHLVSLGLNAARVRTVSYGKEFPFDPADTDEAHASNRRAHFVVTER